MALDVGTKTVGVAVADELGITAQPITTVRRSRLDADLAELEKIARDHGVDTVVVGLPLNMDGSEGPRAVASRQFADAVGRRMGLSVILWDERLTTVAAQRVLLEGDVSRKKRREVVDKVAAALILQGFMAAQGGSGPQADDDEREL
jgi:putative Holliday junction resolvase